MKDPEADQFKTAANKGATFSYCFEFYASLSNHNWPDYSDPCVCAGVDRAAAATTKP